jgi:IPT/TIG domain
MAERQKGEVPGRRPRRRRGPSPARSDEIAAFEWPAFIAPFDAKLLVERVGGAADDEEEGDRFMGVLRRAWEDTLELGGLYADLPGVLLDDEFATASFTGTLERALGRRPDARLSLPLGRLALKPFPNGDASFPCRPHFAVNPFVVYAITHGVDRVAGPDAELRDAYLGTLQDLWLRTKPLDDMLRLAGDHSLDGERRLRTAMRILVRGAQGDAPGRRPGPEALPDIAGDVGFPGPDEPGAPGWLPPRGSPPPAWPPPDGVLPDRLKDVCAFLGDLCRHLVFGGIKGLTHVPVATYLDGLASISPKTGCAGSHITLTGTFPPTQPADVAVIIGSALATVISWSDKEIVIEVPPNVTSGCVAFINLTIEAQRLSAHQQNQEAFGSLAEGLACLGQPAGVAGGWPKVPLAPSKAPCSGFNHLTVGPPVIGFFTVNNAQSITVTPNTGLTLAWSVANASSVQLTRISTSGPPVNTTAAPAGSLALGPFTGTQPTTATYRLTATNACGSVQATVTVALAQPPTLGVIRVEVVQSIQTAANTVRLVASKRTLVRVFVDSGIANGFDSGAGPNNQGNVTGRLTISPSTGGPAVGAGPPINPGGAIVAQSGGGSRALLNDSLNFELPLGQLSGGRRLDVTVFVAGRENDPSPGWRATGSLTVAFTSIAGQEILPFLVADGALGVGSRPTPAQFATSLQGARTRLPIAQNGFAVNPAILDTTSLAEDLTSTVGWGLLVTRLAMTIFLFPTTPVGGIRTALVPLNAAYPLNGIALPRILLTAPTMVSQATCGATYAHEMCHLAGAGHTPCGGPAPPIEPGVPGRTEDIAIDVPTRTIFPAGSPELMSLCGTGVCGADRWIAIALYNGRMFGAFPI